MSLTTRLNIDAIEDGSIPLVKLEEEVAVKSDIPTSVPADGGNSDTVDGKHASDFATADHTHSVINNDFTVYTAVEYGDEYAGVADYGLLQIDDYGTVNIESNMIWDEYDYAHNRITLNDGIDIDSNDTININGDNTVSVNGGTVSVNGEDTVNIGILYDNKSAINITDSGIEIHNGDNVTDGYNDDNTIDVNGTITITKEFDIDETEHELFSGESIVKLEANSRFEDAESSLYDHDNSAQIMLSAYQYNQQSQSGSQSKIEISADNISIKSNSNSASNKVFTTNGGIATLPTVPSSLKNPHALTVQANGTTIDSYDGSSAKTINITPASLGLSIVFDYKGVTTTPLTDGSTTKPIVIDGSSYTQKAGDVVIVNGDNDKEYFWNGTKWEELGRSIDLSGYAPANHTHDRFNDLVHFDGAIHICKNSEYASEYDEETGDEYETERITGIYFSDSVEEGVDAPAYTFIREEDDDRLRVHSNYELKLSTGGYALGLNTLEIEGPNIRIINSPHEDDSAVEESIRMNANNGVFVNGNEVAAKKDIPSSLKNPHSLTIQKNGTTLVTYDGSSAKTINITVPTIPTSLPADGGNADTVDGKHAKDFVPSFAAVSVNDQKTNAIGYTYNNEEHGGKHTGGFITASAGGVYGMQINGSYTGDAIAYRGIQNGTFTEWKPLVLKSDLTTELSKYALKTTVPGDAGSWCTPIYISGGKSYTVNAIEDTLIRWKHPDQIGPGANLQSLFSPLDTATSLLHSANRLAFGNPDGITVEYSIDGGTTWVDYGLTNAQKINLISNQSSGATLLAGKALSTRATANDKLRITINASRVGFYTSAKALYINFSTQGSENCTLDVERAPRGSETNFATWKTGLILNGWSGWNKLPLGSISFGGGDHQTSNVGAIRLTISSSGASSSYTGGCHFGVYDLQLVGDTTWSTCSNMGKNGHLYSHDYNQNAIFPANVTATGFTKKDSSDSYVLLGGGGHKLLSEITSTGSVSWNDITGRPTSLPANGGNADTVDNKHASDFAAANHAHTVRLSGSITPNITASYSNGVLTLNGASTSVSMVGTSEAEGASPNPESWFVSPDDLASLL